MEETLEEAAGNWSNEGSWCCPISFKEGAKWQQEQNKQDFKALWDYMNERSLNFLDDELPQLGTFEEWFEQFKKK